MTRSLECGHRALASLFQPGQFLSGGLKQRCNRPIVLRKLFLLAFVSLLGAMAMTEPMFWRRNLIDTNRTCEASLKFESGRSCCGLSRFCRSEMVALTRCHLPDSSPFRKRPSALVPLFPSRPNPRSSPWSHRRWRRQWHLPYRLPRCLLVLVARGGILQRDRLFFSVGRMELDDEFAEDKIAISRSPGPFFGNAIVRQDLRRNAVTSRGRFVNFRS